MLYIWNAPYHIKTLPFQNKNRFGIVKIHVSDSVLFRVSSSTEVKKMLWKLNRQISRSSRLNFLRSASTKAEVSVPKSADVVVIGGGSAGCHTLYHLAKRGVKAVLLERSKLTAGTTWHTAGLVWRLRPNDVDVELLNNSRQMLINVKEETGLDPGWIQNGGIFIAHVKVTFAKEIQKSL